MGWVLIFNWQCIFCIVLHFLLLSIFVLHLALCIQECALYAPHLLPTESLFVQFIKPYSYRMYCYTFTIRILMYCYCCKYVSLVSTLSHIKLQFHFPFVQYSGSVREKIAIIFTHFGKWRSYNSLIFNFFLLLFVRFKMACNHFTFDIHVGHSEGA